MSCILFYSPFNQRSRDTESLMIAFHHQGHNVLSLSQQEGNVINDFLKANGVKAFSHTIKGKRNGWWYYLRHLIFFIKFCWRHRVDIVYSHLEPANFVASMGQFVIRARTYLCRHHIDEGSLYKFDRDLYYRTTYSLAKRIIVVSSQAKKYMIEREGIPEHKIIHINLAYDFNLYGKPNENEITKIRGRYNSEILLLGVCRFTTHKRPDLIIRSVKKLTDIGLDVKLVLLGKGEMQSDLQELVRSMGLERKVFMPGYVSNVLEYMAAADFFLHPSLLDSSCVAVKEAGLVSRPVIVCRGVGDFDDYLVNEKNGFLVDRENFVEDSVKIILKHWNKKEELLLIGGNLKESVLNLFNIDNVVKNYDLLNTK